MNFELRNELANFETKFGIFWQKFCEINCNVSLIDLWVRLILKIHPPPAKTDALPQLKLILKPLDLTMINSAVSYVPHQNTLR